MERGVLVGVATLRWVAWGWAAAVTVANLTRIRHPALAVVVVAIMGAVTLLIQAMLASDQWARAMRPAVLGPEVAVAAAAVVADGWVRQGRITGQSLAGTWPLAAILAVAVAAGPLWGGGAGAVLGAARALAAVVGGVTAGQTGRTAVALGSTMLFWVAVGVVCGQMVRVLRQTRDQLAEAAVRERIGRDLHDGVLQTLALIERRSPSPELSRLARDQERELRAYLFGDHRHPGTLGAELRAVAATAEARWPDMVVTVTVTDDVPTLSPAQVEAAAGAAAEAVTNAAKHGRAGRAVVFADLDESSGGLFLTVKDDGAGFEPAAVAEGVGMGRSIRDRIERLGGAVEFSAAPGNGCEVRLRLPARASSSRHG